MLHTFVAYVEDLPGVLTRVASLFRRLNIPWGDEVDRYLEESNQPGTGTVSRRTGEQATERWRTTLGDDAKVVQGILDLFPPCQGDRPRPPTSRAPT